MTAHLTASRRASADRVLAALAGPGAALRPDQESAVAALCEPAARVLLVQATGWGKSAVYWAATAIRRAEGHGLTLVVSPLLALMRDQVAAAAAGGLRAATLNSGNVEAWAKIEAAIAGGDLDVLLVSPERLANPGFGRRVLSALAGRLGLLVIDEAHAVSDWGHDFRPDYRRVADVLEDMEPATPVLATTATANARVTADVATQLGPHTLVLRGPLARSSLHLAVLPPMNPLQRYAWVVDHLPRLPGSGIVYTLTVADAERLTAVLQAAHGDAAPVAAYTGRLPGPERHALEDGLRDNRFKALVATSALGMGYDKPDLGFVVHTGAPPSPVSYYQQVGRAGRAIDRAVVALLPSAADAPIWEHFATATLPDESAARRVLTALPPPDAPGISPVALEAGTGLRRTRVELLLKQLAVDAAVERTESGWRATGAEWTYDAAHYAGILATRRREAHLMTTYVRGGRCLMALLQEALDDPDADDCGRCSVCRGVLPEGLVTAPQSDTTHRVAAHLRGADHVLEPRRMWPGGDSGRRGRIAGDEAAEEGRILIRHDAPEWAAVREQCLDTDGPATPELLDAAVAALARWRATWRGRPEVVLPLSTRPGGGPLASDVAAHIAAVGRLDLGSWDVGAPPSAEAGPGPAEAAAWIHAVETAPAPGAAVTARVVLLVVDRDARGWPTTVAAARLRREGAAAVLPLVVHEGS